ncbi:phosphate system positive regulatory protein pho81 [Entomophthora muscae]|uniref:Phosphate system positive regulatory protein pho81 n=2 Tax=Entomophthora muscae TaxID=34485 RepID=A0ACC2SB96_9FUNG|nr:phosphate system positive regulatory protein pho81 [Entomophthora muscae]
MKFGKQIQHQARPEWSTHYMNYKGLKKIIGKGPVAGKGMLTVASIPGNCELPNSPSTLSASVYASDPGPEPQHTPSPIGSGEGTDNAAFFYRLDRELEKVNGFYLKKEDELKLRLRSLTEKRKVIQNRPGMRHGQTALWIAIREAFTQYQADLDKLQQFVEINGTGFRKILKKFDKRSFSKTKDLYLARQVRIQQCFSGSVMAELSDACASNLAAIQAVLDFSTPHASPPGAAFANVDDVEGELFKALTEGGSPEFLELAQRHPEILSRVFWRACSEGAPVEMVQQLIMLGGVDCCHADDITGRAGLHETAIRGDVALAQVCLANGADPQGVDMYGRTPLHYTAMHGHQELGALLLDHAADPSLLDHEGHSALIYAISAGHTRFAQTLISLGHLGGDAARALLIACQFGHQDIAEVLLESTTIDSTLDDLQPLHRASREGHAEICRLLCRHKVDLDALDSDKGWSPLFFAAAEGHVECVRALIEAGCRVDIADESGLTCVYYAAYEGHVACVQALLNAGCPPDSFVCSQTCIDEIPSLLLPPPLLPFRIYGHNYLDRSHLVQIQLSHPPVRLYGNSSMASLRLILAPRPDQNGDAQNIILPLADPQQVYSFEVASLENFGVNFTIFPTFGTQPMGKAAALPVHFSCCAGQTTCPLFDAHLKVVGELTFKFSVISPYTTAALEVGGTIDTYWRAPAATPLLSTGGSLASLVTESSLAQEYLQLVVHVTRDRIPVVFPNRFLDLGGLEICPSSLTYAQYCRLTHPSAISWVGDDIPLANLRDAVHAARSSLSETLAALPPALGVCLEVSYSAHDSGLSIDYAADAILDVVYAHVREFAPQHPQRAFIFTSFHPSVCNALNWKQPNYAVFISTHGGWGGEKNVEGTSLKTAVHFAKRNNLLGIICQDTPLRQVPELARRIKEDGLLLATFGANNSNAGLSKEDPVQASLDIIITDGVLRYNGGS